MINQSLSNTLSVANYFIEKARDRGGIDFIKLQQLIFYAHGWVLTVYHKPLIDEYIEASTAGAFIPSFHKARILSQIDVDKPIEKPFRVYVWYRFGEVTPSVKNSHLRHFLGIIWKTYGGYSLDQLTKVDRKKKSEWTQVAREFEYELPHNERLSNSRIQLCFIDQWNNINIKRLNGSTR